jgi:predicted acetyltransferase
VLFRSPENNSFKYDDYYECLPSKTLSIIDGLEKEKNEFEAFQKVFNKIEIFCPNIDTYIKNYSLSGTPIEKLLRAMDIKSIYSVPIKYDGKLLGYIILQYKNEYKNLKIDDLAFLEKMAKQIGIVINNQN